MHNDCLTPPSDFFTMLGLPWLLHDLENYFIALNRIDFFSELLQFYGSLTKIMISLPCCHARKMEIRETRTLNNHFMFYYKISMPPIIT